ncbi:prepilin-type N-terminal cleavage/methylation domain-containing protein [Candidatus Uhrbacteria bacterium]|nr:prepilin-type N-terminal cleavage/methylation domain-containing protein [Candidatus Uhrbacteria bacterium]MBI4812251.1 prepilin-type N-terminal cleavage/methylation domain-containing protein [Candidatus Falkowbacteria bacterium]
MAILTAKSYKLKAQKGFSLVEALLATSIFALLTTAFVGAYLYGQSATAVAGQRARALMIAEEGLEASRNIRDSGYNNLSVGTHGLTIASNQWNFSGASDATDIFTREIIVASVDADRKNVTSNVTWQQNPQRTGSVSLITRFTDWLSTSGAAPTLFGTFNLTTANSGNENTDAISIATAGNYVYLGRSTNPGNEFFVFDVTDPSNPILSVQLALSGDPLDIAVSSNYAYIASTDNSGELTVVDISTSSFPTIAAVFNLTAANSGSANNNGLSVVIGKTNYIYLTRKNSGGKEFYVFDVSTPTSPSLVGSVDLLGDADEMTADGNYAYLASSENTQEFQVVDVTTVSTPTLVASLNLDEGDTAADGLSIARSANTIYLGRSGSTGSPEFYVIDVTTPTSPTITSYLDIGTHILQSIDYSSFWQSVFLANTNPANDDYNSVDVSVPATTVLQVSLNLDGTPYKLIYSSSLDKVFFASGSDTQELQVVSP